MRKRISFALCAIVIITATVTVCFTGCSQTLTEQEGREILAQSIQNALDSDTYYIKYRYNDNSSSNGKFVQYGLNVQGGTAKFTIAQGDVLKTVYDDTYYGRSLKKDADSKTATESDYVTGKVYWEEDKWKVAPCTLEEYLNDTKIAGYNMNSVAALLDGLTAEELQIKSVSRTGKVVYMDAKVTKESSPLSQYSELTIRIINDKLSYIGDSAESFYVSISFGGPKITVPSWSE